jgi:hypothetical protein
MSILRQMQCLIRTVTQLQLSLLLLGMMPAAAAQGDARTGAFGQSIAAYCYDGSGAPNAVLIADPMAATSGHARGVIHVVSAELRSVVASIPNPFKKGMFGFGVIGLLDLDGDGNGEIGAFGCEDNGSKLQFAVSTSQGQVLYRYSASASSYRARPFVRSPMALNICDVDQDGTNDIAVLWSLLHDHDSSNELSVVSGATGALIWRLRDGQMDQHQATSVASVAIWGAHRFPALVVGYVGAFSGQSAAAGTLRAYDLESGAPLEPVGFGALPDDWSIGRAICAGPDLDGDQCPDILVARIAESGAEAVYAVSTKDLIVLKAWPQQWGYCTELSIAYIDSAPTSRTSSIVVAAPCGFGGAVWLLPTGGSRQSSALAPPEQWLRFGSGLGVVGDWDDDGVSDLAIGTGCGEAWNSEPGMVDIRSSKSGLSLFCLQ